ncbi:MAG: pilus assembly PilX N-terminal domain-containing protein [Candidatus Saccharimonadales bacterium]
MYELKLKKLQENGFASMTIAIVLIIVLALTTIGFAQLVRREQQSALNKQLGAQAVYAAETGINDITKYLNAYPATEVDTDGECMDSGDLSASNANPIIDSAKDIAYTCVIVDSSPDNLESTIGANESWAKVIRFTNAPGDFNLTIQWTSTTNSNSPKDNTEIGNFYPKGTGTGRWGAAPAVLQVSLTPLVAGAGRDVLEDKTFNTYLYPVTSGSSNSVTYKSRSSDTERAKVIGGICDAAGKNCTSTITVPNSSTGMGASSDGPYLLRILSYYDGSVVTIGTTADGFKNTQALIDVTGKARNVLKRMQVHVPLNGDRYDLPNYALESKNICKRMGASPDQTSFFNPDGSSAVSGACYPYSN